MSEIFLAHFSTFWHFFLLQMPNGCVYIISGTCKNATNVNSQWNDKAKIYKAGNNVS